MFCQVALVRSANVATGRGFFKATIAALRATLIEACRSAETVHTTWLYVQPAQRPRRPKLEQSPFPPTCRSEYFPTPFDEAQEGHGWVLRVEQVD